MINARIKNSVVASRLKNTAPNGRTVVFVANAKVKSTPINARGYKATASSVTTGGGGVIIGNPIGLLLTLTYAATSGGTTTTSSSDFKPNTRIITN